MGRMTRIVREWVGLAAHTAPQLRRAGQTCRRSALLVVTVAVATFPWHASELGHSPRSNWSAPQTLVYRDSAAFRGAWMQLFPAPSLRPALPAIDFAKYRVVIVASGSRPTGGYRLALDEGHVVGDTALIGITAFTPPAGCGVTQELTAPAVAIAVPSSPTGFRITTRARPDTVRCN